MERSPGFLSREPAPLRRARPGPVRPDGLTSTDQAPYLPWRGAVFELHAPWSKLCVAELAKQHSNKTLSKIFFKK